MTRLSRYVRLLRNMLSTGWGGFAFTLILPSLFFGVWLHSHFGTSAANYRANEAAAAQFVASVNAEWFFNKPLITQNLERMATTYIATEEDDPAELGELRRLKAWVPAAVSVADQQQFIAEVRQHGKVLMARPFSVMTELAVCLTVLLWLVSFPILFRVIDTLDKSHRGRAQPA